MEKKQGSQFTEQEFEQKVIKSIKPILVDFYADWCAACKSLEPVIDQFKEQYRNKIEVIKINVDQNQGVSSKFHVMSLPTLMVFHKGKVANQIIGAIGLDELKQKLNEFL